MAKVRLGLWCAALGLLILVGSAGCGVLPPTATLRPTLDRAGERFAATMPAALPRIKHAEKVAVVEPFAVVRAEEGGLTTLVIDEPTHRARGAWLSVNGGPWTTAATVRRGDRVDIAYTRPSAGGSLGSAAAVSGVSGGGGGGALSYVVYGPTTKGYVRLVETRTYLDGYPEENRSLRVLPYAIERAASAGR